MALPGHKGYATPVHQDAIRRLGPCSIHRQSFDYIRELCGEYSEVFYALKARRLQPLRPQRRPYGLGEANREARDSLSPMEIKKLLLMASRLWKRTRS